MTQKKRMPTKAELVQLQKLYKTDEKIGERLGGVPAYLVAYWRRKKNVPRHSLPKFSEREVRSLWERYGDDDRCGLELGISKAAFYNWRRRYSIREKPAFLKLEQLELAFPGIKTQSGSQSLWGHQTVAQKIICRAAKLEKVEVGQEVEIEPDLALVHRDIPEIINSFGRMGVEYVWNSERIVLAIEAAADSGTDADLAAIREFAHRQRLKHVYDFTDGYPHPVALEAGHMVAGCLAVGTDSNALAFGALAGLGLVCTTEQMARLWATGTIKMQVPSTMRVDISGRRPRGVFTKDIALSIIKQMSQHDISGKAIEYYGSAISHMNISERYALSVMASAMGAATVACQFDSSTRRYLAGRSISSFDPVMTDKNATYDEMYQINIDHIPAQIGCPGGADQIKPVSEVENLPVHTIVIGTGCNGRFDDLRIAADILKGNKIDPNCRLLVYPATRTTYLEALKKGLIRVLAEAGAVIMPAGIDACPEANWPQVAEGERCLTTGCFRSIAEDKKSEVYICSPATAAASALKAAIMEPFRYM